MRTICFYISDYGYGHATRSIAIIRRMMEASAFSSNMKVIVRSGKTLPFLRKSLQGCSQNIEFEPFFGDLGYVLKEGTLQADLEGLRSNYERYMEAFPHLVEGEADFLQRRKADLIISDISPVPFVAAYLTGLPSVGISNFTWYTAYRDMLEERLLKPLYDAYSHMRFFIKLPGADEPPWNTDHSIEVGYFCRKPDQSEVERIRRLLNPGCDKMIILISVGMSISLYDLQELPLWNQKDCMFVVSSNMKVTGDNIHSIPMDYAESQNYAAASDLIITKPGWGTIAEGISLNKPMFILRRSHFREDDNTINSVSGLSGVELLEWNSFQHVTLSPASLRTSLLLETAGRVVEQDPLHNIVVYLDHIMHNDNLKESQRSEAI